MAFCIFTKGLHKAFLCLAAQKRKRISVRGSERSRQTSSPGRVSGTGGDTKTRTDITAESRQDEDAEEEEEREEEREERDKQREESRQ